MSALSDRQMDNGKSKLEKYISYISNREMDNGKSKL